jgi:chemotaxis protein methyltransferase CheR
MQLTTTTNAQVERLRVFAARRLGLRFDDEKSGFLSEILQRRSQSTRQAPELYLEQLESGRGSEREIGLLVQDLTVTETYFFRSFAQFRAFTEVALPARLRARAGTRRLRILSAGCASGEEPYSLAILTRGRPELEGWQVDLRAIDVNAAMLEKATRARYSSWALRETPADVQARCFRAVGGDFVLADEFRAMVSFEERNLVEDAPTFWVSESFDVVFFRNVVMYFTPEVAQAVVARIARSLAPGGYLFLGYAETLRGLSQDFHLHHTHDTFYYQRRESGGEAPEAPAPRSANDSSVPTVRRASDAIDAPSTRLLPGGASEAAMTPAFELGPAVQLMRLERFAEAEALLAALPPESARDADVILLRAVLLTHGGDLSAAEGLCAEVLRLDEMSAGAHYLMALCREGAGDRAGAASHDQLAVYLDPAFAMPHMHLGMLARRAGNAAEARRELTDALMLLQREDPSRLLLFSGGFSREALIGICRAELASCGGAA